MKKAILYLFIFSLLMNIFIYMYFNNKVKYEESRIEGLQKTTKAVKDSLSIEKDKVLEADYFSLMGNSNALDYFAGEDVNALAIRIRDGIYAQNINPQGNPLAQYPPMNGKRFTINKIRILNNRWVIADFSNGTVWGEVLLRYYVNGSEPVTFEVIQTMLYPNTVN